MDYFQLTNSINQQSDSQSNLMESLIISQNCTSNIQLPKEIKDMKANSNVFLKSISENLQETINPKSLLSISKNPTQVVEEEDYVNAQSNYNIERQDIKDLMRQDSLGTPEIIDVNSANPKILRCIQLKLKQDQKQQEKMNLADQIYETNGKEEVKIGRAKQTSDIVLNDELHSISSNHAVFYYNTEKQAWYLRDNNSSNGTFLVINNSPIKKNDQIAIGLYVCTVEYQQNFNTNDFDLTFKSMVDDSIEPFKLSYSLQFDQKLMIGKSFQHQLKDDPMIANHQCYIQFQNRKMKIWNCSEAEYKIAKIIQSNKSVKVKNDDLVRFGLVNYYIFSEFTKKVESKQSQFLKDKQKITSQQPEEDECCICLRSSQSFTVLNPCNHSKICMECVLELIDKQNKCPICQGEIIDFRPMNK